MSVASPPTSVGSRCPTLTRPWRTASIDFGRPSETKAMKQTRPHDHSRREQGIFHPIASLRTIGRLPSKRTSHDTHWRVTGPARSPAGEPGPTAASPPTTAAWRRSRPRSSDQQSGTRWNAVRVSVRDRAAGRDRSGDPRPLAGSPSSARFRVPAPGTCVRDGPDATDRRPGRVSPARGAEIPSKARVRFITVV